jgi:DNA-binding transcriptional ArsR family regulator
VTADPVSRDPFEALGDANRRVIVELLRDGPMSVSDISRRMPISQPAVSRHLRLLKQAHLVTDEPEGARRMYRLSDEGADAVRSYMQRVWGEAAVRFRVAAENTRDPQERR